MDDARIEIIFCTPVFDRVIDEFIRDEDKSPSPERTYPMSVEYLSDKVSDNFGLTMISSKLDTTIYRSETIERCHEKLHSFVIVSMCDIEFYHE